MRRVVAAVVGALAVAVAPLAPAFADSTVVVHGLDFPTGRTAQLSFVGCTNPYDRGAEELRPFIGIGPEQAPTGKRSLGYDLVGTGNAIGSLHYVDSMAATTVAGLSVHAAQGAAGVAYAGYQEPADRGTGLVWFGRAPLSVPAGGWTRVDAPGLTYTWTKYDMLAQQPVAEAEPGGSATISRFQRAHGGDGPGFFTLGFGCDGRAFSMDAWRIGRPGLVTTYDLEGLVTTTTAVAGPDGAVESGTQVTLRGSVLDGSGAPVPGARLVLEALSGQGTWQPVEGSGTAAGTDLGLSAPDVTTTYRWRFVDRPLAEGSVSAPFTVQVRPAPEPSADPSDKPSDKPTDKPTDKATPEPTAKPSDKATAKPTVEPTTEPSQEPTSERRRR